MFSFEYISCVRHFFYIGGGEIRKISEKSTINWSQRWDNTGTAEMSKDQADDAVSEPSKFSGTKLRFSSTENIWSEANDKRFGNLSQAYAEQRDEMSRDDVLEFCRLSMKKNQILEDKKKSKTKHRQSKEAETPLKGSYFGASASSNWADEMDADDIRKSRDKKMDKQHRRDPSSGSSTNSDDDSCSDTHSSGSSDESGEDVPQTMSEVERRLGKMIERKFYNLVDSDRTQSKDGELRPPKLGTKRALSDKLERELKSSGRNLQFGDKTSNSKPLRFVLEQHRSFSSRGRLNNKASINLLLRFLNSQPFTMVNSLRNSGADVGLIYSQLQTAYRDVLDPQQATKALDSFLESPSLVQLTKVSAKILELSSLVHQFESKKTRALNIQVTATSYFQQYLNRYYSRQDSCRVNDQLLRWKSRNTSLANPLQIYFQLGSIASTQLIGMLPSYARNLGAKRPEDRPPRAPYQPNQHQHQVQILETSTLNLHRKSQIRISETINNSWRIKRRRRRASSLQMKLLEDSQDTGAFSATWITILGFCTPSGNHVPISRGSRQQRKENPAATGDTHQSSSVQVHWLARIPHERKRRSKSTLDN